MRLMRLYFSADAAAPDVAPARSRLGKRRNAFLLRLLLLSHINLVLPAKAHRP